MVVPVVVAAVVLRIVIGACNREQNAQHLSPEGCRNDHGTKLRCVGSGVEAAPKTPRGVAAFLRGGGDCCEETCTANEAKNFWDCGTQPLACLDPGPEDTALAPMLRGIRVPAAEEFHESFED